MDYLFTPAPSSPCRTLVSLNPDFREAKVHTAIFIQSLSPHEQWVWKVKWLQRERSPSIMHPSQRKGGTTRGGLGKGSREGEPKLKEQEINDGSHWRQVQGGFLLTIPPRGQIRHVEWAISRTSWRAKSSRARRRITVLGLSALQPSASWLSCRSLASAVANNVPSLPAEVDWSACSQYPLRLSSLTTLAAW